MGENPLCSTQPVFHDWNIAIIIQTLLGPVSKGEEQMLGQKGADFFIQNQPSNSKLSQDLSDQIVVILVFYMLVMLCNVSVLEAWRAESAET